MRFIPLLLLLFLPAWGQRPPANIARPVARNLGLEGRVMWVDATANLSRTTSAAGVADIVARCKKANFNALVVDVKPISGEVLYPSQIAPRLKTWYQRPATPEPADPDDFKKWAAAWPKIAVPEFDVLGAFVEEGHKAGLAVYASFNVFAEGHKYFGQGPGFEKREWQAVAIVPIRSLVAADGARLPVRAEGEPDDVRKPLIYEDETPANSAPAPGQKTLALFDAEGRVTGIVDAALLGDEPLFAPEGGRWLALANAARAWADAHLRPGQFVRYELATQRASVMDAPGEKVAVFVNPIHPDARRREIELMTEAARNYAVDGIVFDRMRYANIYNDFSDRSRQAFAQWLNKPVERWPDDVMAFPQEPGKPLVRGRYFAQWMEWRARTIRDFVAETTQAIRAVRPDIEFGAYVGSWYNVYYSVGVNWGSERAPKPYAWAEESYSLAGYAEFLDFLTTGCYYPIATREEARRLGRRDEETDYTVEGAAQASMEAAANGTPVYAGISLEHYGKNPDGFARALEAAAHNSLGVMVFDLSYIYDNDYWTILERAFPQPAAAPHKFPGLAGAIRAASDAGER